MEVAEWQQQWRIPAFGEWNYGVDGNMPLTPCFDVVAVRMTNTLVARKPNERPGASGNARRRRVPAFGEWNNNGGDCSWPAPATPFSDLFAAQKPPETQRRRYCDGGVAEAYGRGRSKVADSGAYAAKKSCFTVVPKAVDDDLYGVPPGIFHQKPARRRGWLRFLLMAGCFCPGGTNTA